MTAALIVLVIAFAVYVAAMFHVSKFLVPHLRKLRAAETLPPDLERTVDRLTKEHKDDKAFIRSLLEVLKHRYHTRRAKMFLYPRRFFFQKLEEVPPRESHPCTILNYAFVTMLTHSGRFTEEDIGVKYTWVNGIIHQYLSVRMKDGTELDVDPWGYGIGRCAVGEYARGFL